mmetsp:Transcript_39794/g.89166  ORF Transcript_39794/g.89166 Transcript_39794/m.89166 type:complete len:119 (-) Transcript_39794:1577-1933(-)
MVVDQGMDPNLEVEETLEDHVVAAHRNQMVALVAQGLQKRLVDAHQSPPRSMGCGGRLLGECLVVQASLLVEVRQEADQGRMDAQTYLVGALAAFQTVGVAMDPIQEGEAQKVVPLEA